MASPDPGEITRLLKTIASGDRAAMDRLMPLVYPDLRALAGHFLRREGSGHTLQPTELVNEAFLKLVDQTRVDWKGRSHFFAIGATAMRRILVDHARAKLSKKRGQRPVKVELHDDMMISTARQEDVLALDQALDRLAELDPEQARIVELRFFGGLTVEEVAEVLGVSKRKVEAEWTVTRAWLRRELSAPPAR